MIQLKQMTHYAGFVINKIMGVVVGCVLWTVVIIIATVLLLIGKGHLLDQMDDFDNYENY